MTGSHRPPPAPPLRRQGSGDGSLWWTLTTVCGSLNLAVAVASAVSVVMSGYVVLTAKTSVSAPRPQEYAGWSFIFSVSLVVCVMGIPWAITGVALTVSRTIGGTVSMAGLALVATLFVVGTCAGEAAGQLDMATRVGGVLGVLALELPTAAVSLAAAVQPPRS